MKFLTFFILALLALNLWAFPSGASSQQVFCAEIKGLYFKEFGGRIRAFGYLSNLRSYPSKKVIQPAKLVLTDPKAVFKLAKSVSEYSTQNSKELIENLRSSNFEWDSLVGPELSPYPYEEAFTACLKGDLSRIDEQNTLSIDIEIVDILEDGYSILD